MIVQFTSDGGAQYCGRKALTEIWDGGTLQVGPGFGTAGEDCNCVIQTFDCCWQFLVKRIEHGIQTRCRAWFQRTER